MIRSLKSCLHVFCVCVISILQWSMFLCVSCVVRDESVSLLCLFLSLSPGVSQPFFLITANARGCAAEVGMQLCEVFLFLHYFLYSSCISCSVWAWMAAQETSSVRSAVLSHSPLCVSLCVCAALWGVLRCLCITHVFSFFSLSLSHSSPCMPCSLLLSVSSSDVSSSSVSSSSVSACLFCAHPVCMHRGCAACAYVRVLLPLSLLSAELLCICGIKGYPSASNINTNNNYNTLVSSSFSICEEARVCVHLSTTVSVLLFLLLFLLLHSF